VSIQVTLNFPTEADLLAFFANKQATLGNPVAQPAGGQATAKASAAPAPKAESKATAAPSAETSQQASTAATTPQATGASEGNAGAALSAEAQPSVASTAAPASSQTGTVDYATLQKAVFALAGKDKPAAMALATSLGVKTFKDLPADRWGEALAAVNAKLAELG
jgi:hypothetical protein